MALEQHEFLSILSKSEGVVCKRVQMSLSSEFVLRNQVFVSRYFGETKYFLVKLIVMISIFLVVER